MPKTVEVEFSPPPALRSLPAPEYRRRIAERTAGVEAEAAAARRQTGTVVLGRRHILAQRWEDRPTDAEPRRQLSPAVACRDKWLRIERLQMNKLFQDVYRGAFQALREGLVALFPLGTWLMRFRAAIQVSTA